MLTDTTLPPLDDDHRPDIADPLSTPRGRGRGKRNLMAEVGHEPDVALRSLIPWGESVVCWSPLWFRETHRSTLGQVAVFRLGDRKTAAQVEAFACHGGGVEMGYHEITSKQAQTEALRLFNRIVLEGLRPRLVHAAFLRLKPYVMGLHETVPGARRSAGRHRESNGDDYAP
ncbi:hypothetical protein MBRA_02483 [Methylobacterium brachiatum]|nr:hypothetical protein MBRA_02483 [Methylobacterium brachiatum]